MRAQHARADALPLTWEIPGLIAFGWLVLAVVGLPVGQAVAFAVCGCGFAWPGDVSVAVRGLLTGRPGVGVAGAPSAWLSWPSAVSGCGPCRGGGARVARGRSTASRPATKSQWCWGSGSCIVTGPSFVPTSSGGDDGCIRCWLAPGPLECPEGRGVVGAVRPDRWRVWTTGVR